MLVSAAARKYYYLAKPGIVYGNAIVAIGGFLLASGGNVRAGLLLASILGLSLVIASACVFNNYIDRSIDAKMSRTKKRALVSGSVSSGKALLYGSVLGLMGFILLIVYTNPLTVLLSLLGYIVYIFVYGVAKRRSVHGTLVGSISGAIPPVAGYTAVTGSLDFTAVLLFLILTAWQMPHFYAIAIFRRRDYAAAGLPVLPNVRGIKAARQQIIAWVLLFIALTAALTGQEITGFSYLLVMLALSFYWLYLGLKSFEAYENPDQWARQVFGWSLIVIIGFSLMISTDSWLP